MESNSSYYHAGITAGKANGSSARAEKSSLFCVHSIRPSAIHLPREAGLRVRRCDLPLFISHGGGPKRRGLLGGETLLIHIIQPNGQLSAPNSHLRNPSPTKIRGGDATKE